MSAMANGQQTIAVTIEGEAADAWTIVKHTLLQREERSSYSQSDCEFVVNNREAMIDTVDGKKVTNELSAAAGSAGGAPAGRN